MLFFALLRMEFVPHKLYVTFFLFPNLMWVPESNAP